MMNNKILLVFMVFLLIGIPLVSSFKDTIINFEAENGLDVVANFYRNQEINQPMQLHIFVFNKSGGNLVSSPLAQCQAELTDSNGTLLMEGLAQTHENHFLMSRPANIITEPGIYSVTLWCNTSNLDGYTTAFFEANKSGTDLTISNSIFYGFVFLLIGLFLFFSINGIRNATSGSWMVAYISLTYILIYVLMGIFYLLAENFLWATPIIENIMYIVWFIMGVGFLPFIIVLSLYILGQEAKAVMEKDYLKQGYTRDEAKDLAKKNHR